MNTILHKFTQSSKQKQYKLNKSKKNFYFFKKQHFILNMENFKYWNSYSIQEAVSVSINIHNPQWKRIYKNTPRGFFIRKTSRVLCGFLFHLSKGKYTFSRKVFAKNVSKQKEKKYKYYNAIYDAFISKATFDF